jgi:hypothetical protein
MARQCELARHVAADGAGAEYADLHSSLLFRHPTTDIIESPGFGEYLEI